MKPIHAIMAAAIVAAAPACSNKAADNAGADGVAVTTVKHPDWAASAVIYEVNLRQYTDSASITAFDAQLPRLKELGVDILWFMPINPISQDGRKGTLGSYYAVADYEAFNPEFGTLDQFRQTVRHAHEMGMHVILDWVPNHSGRDNKWVTQHPDWYETDSLGNMKGVYDWTDVYVFNYDNPEMRKGMINAMKFWLDSVGVDGFRCDVAMEVPTDFWNDCRKELQAVKPDLFMLAEATVPELQADAFDMGYNWPMKDLFSQIAATAGQYTFAKAGEEPRTFEPVRPAEAIDSLLKLQAETFPRGTILMNMTSNHDLNSWEGTEFERLGNLSEAFAALSYVLPGMPLIYTGQETGMNRAFEFFEKDKAPEWEPRNRFFTLYQQLNTLKHTQPALNVGQATEAGLYRSYPAKDNNVYVLERTAQTGPSRVLYIANLGAEATSVEFASDAPEMKGLHDYISGAEAEMPATLLPGQYMIFCTPAE